MQTAKGYQMTPLLGVISHYKATVPMVRDGVDKMWWDQERQLQISTQVRSGDYFATLATKLDELSEHLQKTDEATAYDLEILVADLLHLQRNYIISKKK